MQTTWHANKKHEDKPVCVLACTLRIHIKFKTHSTQVQYNFAPALIVVFTIRAVNTNAGPRTRSDFVCAYDRLFLTYIKHF